ncbi:MAG: sulfatase-like hydrolase/transferase [Alphaproteobacteria bacterium]|nr:sulfatase-like hydrolase/transferase [Alphaproteobacteria bacterium]MBL6937276.1 sulfatase-like hydrolase/transferase [Alphaproteobacteria bacterium]MBL7096162.1 sulfatase-like hydrolase/transferase [Alphaproteobacteria bacterium]
MAIRKRWIALGVVAVVAAAGYVEFQQYWYYLPGIIGRLRDPVRPNQPVTWAQGPATAPAGPRKPNVVFILADDLGFNDPSFNGGGVAGGTMPTPHIDAISHQGVTFTNGYAGNATCAPSRAAIMTGRYATRFGFEFTPAPKQFERLVATYKYADGTQGIFNAQDEDAVPTDANLLTVPGSEIMIAKLMKDAGYHTLGFGKWHLGGTADSRPEARGFDETLMFYPGASLYANLGDPDIEESRQDFDPIDKFLWANLVFAVENNGGRHFQPSEYMTDYLGDEAVKAIHANRNRPFFMYLAFNAVHTPLQALRSDYDALPQIKDHRLRVYAAMLRALDRNVGKVMDALKRDGIDDNTLVIFTSDNGGAYYIGLPNINKPYRGWKATFFEGGIHVPFFMRWPGKITPGTTYARPVAHVDIFATAAAIAGAPLPTDRKIDGVNLLPFVTGTNAVGAPHKTLFWRSGPYATLLDGEWKIQVMDKPYRKVWLYDLNSDPTEKVNLALSDRAEAETLEKELRAISATQHKPLWPSLLLGPQAIDRPLSYPGKPGEEMIWWAN